MLCDLAIGDAVNAYAADLEFLVGGGRVHERRTGMRAGVRPAFYHVITLCNQLIGHHTVVWERSNQRLMNFLRTIETLGLAGHQVVRDEIAVYDLVQLVEPVGIVQLSIAPDDLLIFCHVCHY